MSEGKKYSVPRQYFRRAWIYSIVIGGLLVAPLFPQQLTPVLFYGTGLDDRHAAKVEQERLAEEARRAEEEIAQENTRRECVKFMRTGTVMTAEGLSVNGNFYGWDQLEAMPIETTEHVYYLSDQIDIICKSFFPTMHYYRGVTIREMLDLSAAAAAKNNQAMLFGDMIPETKQEALDLKHSVEEFTKQAHSGYFTAAPNGSSSAEVALYGVIIDDAMERDFCKGILIAIANDDTQYHWNFFIDPRLDDLNGNQCS